MHTFKKCEKRIKSLNSLLKHDQLLNQSGKQDLNYSENQARAVIKNSSSQRNDDYFLNWKNSNNSNNSTYIIPPESSSFEELLSNFYKNKSKFDNNQATCNNFELLKGIALQNTECINQSSLSDKVSFLVCINVFYKNHSKIVLILHMFH